MLASHAMRSQVFSGFEQEAYSLGLAAPQKGSAQRRIKGEKVAIQQRRSRITDLCEAISRTTASHYKKRIRQRRLYGKGKPGNQGPDSTTFLQFMRATKKRIPN